jgi:molecular chaperone DnaK
LGGVMTTLIERNTTIPTRKMEVFSTAENNQTAVDIHVLQGERPMAKDNMTLGRFRLEGIPPAPRGVPQVEVTFDIDANGILHVTAKDKATNKEQKITITASTNLADNDVDRLVQEAESHRAEDERMREQIELRNRADALAYQGEKLVKDVAEGENPVDPALSTAVEEQVKTLREAIEREDADAMNAAMASLESAMQGLATAMYQQAATEGDDGAAPDEGAPQDAAGEDEDVVEGEFREA